MSLSNGGFGFFHFADCLRQIVLLELLSRILRGFGSLSQGIALRGLLAFLRLLPLLLLHFPERLGDLLLLLLKLLHGSCGILQLGERVVEQFIGLLGGFLRVGEVFRIGTLRFAELLGQFVDFVVNGLFGFLQIVERFSLRLTGGLSIRLVELGLGFFHFALRLLQRFLSLLGSLSLLSILLGAPCLFSQLALLLGLLRQ